jgi:hypothetical protein
VNDGYALLFLSLYYRLYQESMLSSFPNQKSLLSPLGASQLPVRWTRKAKRVLRPMDEIPNLRRWSARIFRCRVVLHITAIYRRNVKKRKF